MAVDSTRPTGRCEFSFANLDDTVYAEIGAALRAIAQEYVRDFGMAQPGGAAAGLQHIWPRWPVP